MLKKNIILCTSNLMSLRFYMCLIVKKNCCSILGEEVRDSEKCLFSLDNNLKNNNLNKKLINDK